MPAIPWRKASLFVFLMAGVLSTIMISQTATAPADVAATVETDPVSSSGDVADDPAIWVHPTQPALSTVIGTDKKTAGLAVYGLDGRLIQFVKMAGANNVDLRNDFLLGTKRITLVIASNPVERTLEAFQVDATTRRLNPVTAQNNKSEVDVWGVCMYRSPKTGRFYVFNIARNGYVEQWEIGNSTGSVTLHRVRAFGLSSEAEGCVADDDNGALYVSEQEKGIWRFDAEPDSGSKGRLIDYATQQSGHLRPDVEGLAIYYAGRRDGYLIASSQGSDSYAVYDRSNNVYIGQFRIGSGTLDGVSYTDGIEVTHHALSPAFPQGLFIAQDDSNRDWHVWKKRQNFKLVPWERIANSFDPKLRVQVVQ
jgi:myo-inositol-hexaphosphate 3-phosphohydrolase